MSLKAGNTNNHSHHIDTMAAVGEFGAAEQEDSGATGFAAVRHAMDDGGGRDGRRRGGGTSGNRLQLFARRPRDEISEELSCDSTTRMR